MNIYRPGFFVKLIRGLIPPATLISPRLHAANVAREQVAVNRLVRSISNRDKIAQTQFNEHEALGIGTFGRVLGKVIDIVAEKTQKEMLRAIQTSSILQERLHDLYPDLYNDLRDNDLI